jgi:hypothetical protein
LGSTLKAEVNAVGWVIPLRLIGRDFEPVRLNSSEDDKSHVVLAAAAARARRRYRHGVVSIGFQLKEPGTDHRQSVMVAPMWSTSPRLTTFTAPPWAATCSRHHFVCSGTTSPPRLGQQPQTDPEQQTADRGNRGDLRAGSLPDPHLHQIDVRATTPAGSAFKA